MKLPLEALALDDYAQCDPRGCLAVRVFSSDGSIHCYRSREPIPGPDALARVRLEYRGSEPRGSQQADAPVVSLEPGPVRVLRPAPFAMRPPLDRDPLIFHRRAVAGTRRVPGLPGVPAPSGCIAA